MITNSKDYWFSVSSPFFWVFSSCCCILTLFLHPCRKYLNKNSEDQDEDLPGLEEEEEEDGPELDSTVLRRRTMAAAAERRLQNLQDPAP